MLVSLYLLVHNIVRFMTVTGTELTLRSNPQKVGYNPQISLKESLTTGNFNLIVISPFFWMASAFLI